MGQERSVHREEGRSPRLQEGENGSEDRPMRKKPRRRSSRGKRAAGTSGTAAGRGGIEAGSPPPGRRAREGKYPSDLVHTSLTRRGTNRTGGKDRRVKFGRRVAVVAETAREAKTAAAALLARAPESTLAPGLARGLPRESLRAVARHPPRDTRIGCARTLVSRPRGRAASLACASRRQRRCHGGLREAATARS